MAETVSATQTWQSLAEMVRESGLDNSNWYGGTDIGWKDNSHASQVVATFYQQWSQYLHPINSLLAMIVVVPEYITKILYYICSNLEGIFTNMFSLFGFIQTINVDGSPLHTVYFWLRAVGIGIFVILLMIRGLMSIMGSTFEWRELMNTLLIVTAGVSLFPTAVSAFTRIMVSDSQSLLTYNFSTEESSSLSIEPIKSQTTDLQVLIKNNFDLNKLGATMDDSGYLSTSKTLNTISDKNIYSTDFTETYGADNKEILDYYHDLAGTDTSSPYYGVSAILQTKKSTLVADDNGNVEEAILVDYKPVSADSIKKVFKTTYLRFKVNWIGVWVEQVILIAFFIALLIQMVKTVISVSFNSVISPLVGMTAIDNPSKYIEVIQEVMGGLGGIWFQILELRLGMWFLSNFQSYAITGGSSTYPTVFSGMNFWQKILINIIVYYGTFLAIMGGSRSIQRWLGIRTGIGRELGQVAAGAYVGSRAAGAAISTAAAGGKGTVAAFKGASQAVAGKKISDGNGGFIKQNTVTGRQGGLINNLAAGGAKGLGAAMGTKSAIQSQGVKRTLSNFGGNMKSGAQQRIKSKYNSVASGLKASGGSVAGNYRSSKFGTEHSLYQNGAKGTTTKFDANGKPREFNVAEERAATEAIRDHNQKLGFTPTSEAEHQATPKGFGQENTPPQQQEPQGVDRQFNFLENQNSGGVPQTNNGNFDYQGQPQPQEYYSQPSGGSGNFGYQEQPSYGDNQPPQQANTQQVPQQSYPSEHYPSEQSQPQNPQPTSRIDDNNSRFSDFSSSDDDEFL